MGCEYRRLPYAQWENIWVFSLFRFVTSAGLKISVPKWPGKWVLSMDEYKDGVVGAKSKNIAGLRGKLPDWVALPASVTLPFGCYEEVRTNLFVFGLYVRLLCLFVLSDKVALPVSVTLLFGCYKEVHTSGLCLNGMHAFCACLCTLTKWHCPPQ